MIFIDAIKQIPRQKNIKRKKHLTNETIERIAKAFNITHVIGDYMNDIPKSAKKWRLENYIPENYIGRFGNERVDPKAILYTRVIKEEEIEEKIEENTEYEDTPIRIIMIVDDIKNENKKINIMYKTKEYQITMYENKEAKRMWSIDTTRIQQISVIEKYQKKIIDNETNETWLEEITKLTKQKVLKDIKIDRTLEFSTYEFRGNVNYEEIEIETAKEIELSYLEELNAYNQNIIQINYLIIKYHVTKL